MPDKSQPQGEPELEIEIIGEYGDTTDPVYNKLVQLVVNTIRDVHLIHAQNGLLSTAQMERGNEHLLLVFIHNVEVIDGDFDDAMTALMIKAAPKVNWVVTYTSKGVVIQGFYLKDMTVDAVNL